MLLKPLRDGRNLGGQLAFTVDYFGKAAAELAVVIHLGEIEILAVEDLVERSPWVASDGLDLGGASRAEPPRGAAEALFQLADFGMESEPLEPLYVEGPPIHGGGDGG